MSLAPDGERDGDADRVSEVSSDGTFNPMLEVSSDGTGGRMETDERFSWGPLGTWTACKKCGTPPSRFDGRYCVICGWGLDPKLAPPDVEKELEELHDLCNELRKLARQVERAGEDAKKVKA